MVIIKKYANRKLYNTSSKKYITLNEIATLIQNGQNVSIFEHKTGDDVSSQILAQIIFELDKLEYTQSSKSIFENLIKNGVGIMNLLSADLFHPTYVDQKIFQRIVSLIRGKILSKEQGIDLLNLLVTDWESEYRFSNIPSREDLIELSSNIDELSINLDRLFNLSS